MTVRVWPSPGDLDEERAYDWLDTMTDRERYDDVNCKTLAGLIRDVRAETLSTIPDVAWSVEEDFDGKRDVKIVVGGGTVHQCTHHPADAYNSRTFSEVPSDVLDAAEEIRELHKRRPGDDQPKDALFWLRKLVGFIRNDQCTTPEMRGPATTDAPCACCRDYLETAEHYLRRAEELRGEAARPDWRTSSSSDEVPTARVEAIAESGDNGSLDEHESMAREILIRRMVGRGSAEDPATPSERAAMPEAARGTCWDPLRGTAGGVSCELPLHHTGDHSDGVTSWPQRRERASQTSTGGESHMPVENPAVVDSSTTKGSGLGDGPVPGGHRVDNEAPAGASESPHFSTPNASKAPRCRRCRLVVGRSDQRCPSGAYCVPIGWSGFAWDPGFGPDNYAASVVHRDIKPACAAMGRYGDMGTWCDYPDGHDGPHSNAARSSSKADEFVAEVRRLKARCITELITLDRAVSQNWTHERRHVWSTVERELDRILRTLQDTQKGGA